MWMPYAQYRRLGWTQPKRPKPLKPKFHTTLEQHKRGKFIHNLKWGFPPHRKGAVDPAFLDDWISRNGPYLYHGTDPEAASHILREGLYPHDDHFPDGREDQIIQYERHDPLMPGEVREYGDDWTPSRSSWAGQFYEPRSGHVYLGTHQYASRYGNGKLLQIDLRKLDPNLINADEDHFNLKTQRSPEHEAFINRLNEFGDYPPDRDDYYPGETETLGQWGDRVLGRDPEATMHSLNSGSVAYEGHIPPHAVSLWQRNPRFDRAQGFIPEPAQHAGWDLSQDPGAPVLAKTDANHWEAKLWHHSDKGLLRGIKPPFLASDQEHPTLVNHPVSVTLRHPVHVFVPLMQAHLDAASGVGSDGVVSHTPEGLQVAVLDPGAVVPGHEHDFPY